MGEILNTQGLTKKYKDKVAVDTLNVSVQEGEIYALIGENGAGKTSFMKMVTGLSIPTRGTVSIGNSKWKSDEIKNSVGALIESPGMIMNMSGYDNIKAKCIYAGKNNSTYIHELLNMVSLGKDAKRKVKHYSLGMKQRLGIALALVGDPRLLILDEPINGLDPHGIAFIRDLIKKINEEKGITILISSHILAELSKVATKYGFISNGKLIEEIAADKLEEKCKKADMSLENYYFNLIGGE